MSGAVTQADSEQQGWLWLDDMVSSISDEDAADLPYTADQMVDAFMAGAATQAAEIARLREAFGLYLRAHGEEITDVDAYIASLQDKQGGEVQP